MNRFLLIPFLLAIGFTSPVKAEPEWIKYDTSFETDLFIDENNLLITKDGIIFMV